MRSTISNRIVNTRMEDLFGGGTDSCVSMFFCSWQPKEEAWANQMPCPINTAEVCAFFTWHRRHPELSGLTDDALFHDPQQTLQHNRRSKGGTTRTHYDNTETLTSERWLKDLYPYILWRVSSIKPIHTRYYLQGVLHWKCNHIGGWFCIMWQKHWCKVAVGWTEREREQ